MNREGIPPAEYRKLADRFRPDRFDAEAIVDLAVAAGMRYIVFTTMHHEGFRLYDTGLSDFSSARTEAKRDFIAEVVAAARSRNLKIGLYHSLNNWFDQPDSVAALEDPQAKERFIEATFQRIRELVTLFQPIDILWYDGWWPFDAKGWEAERMNRMVREIQPHILFNGRNGLPGDFATPEQHLAAPSPWRPWEACVTLNDSWGYHAGDHHWKSPLEVIKMLARVAQGRGNLLLNLGLPGDGSIPEEGDRILREVGEWIKVNREAIFDTELWTVDPYHRGDHRGDWVHHGPITTKGNDLYLIATAPPVEELVISGLEAEVLEVRQLGGETLSFRQGDGRLRVTLDGGSRQTAKSSIPVYRIRCDRPPSIYKTGGMRIPACEHPRYDPVCSDISW